MTATLHQFLVFIVGANHTNFFHQKPYQNNTGYDDNEHSKFHFHVIVIV